MNSILVILFGIGLMCGSIPASLGEDDPEAAIAKAEANAAHAEEINKMGRAICDCITDFEPDRHNRPYCYEGVDQFVRKCDRNAQLKACHNEYDGYVRQCDRRGICRERICLEIGEKHEFIPYAVVVP